MSEFCGVLVPGTFVTSCQLSAGHPGAHRVGSFEWSLPGEDPVVSAPAVDDAAGDVVARARAELARLDGRVDGPFCADCQDVEVGVDVVLVEELVAEVERLRALLGLGADRPAPEEGRVWLYRSSADGAEVLVRWDMGGWETADPDLPSRWYSQDSSLLRWPGTFTELEQGFPR